MRNIWEHLSRTRSGECLVEENPSVEKLGGGSGHYRYYDVYHPKVGETKVSTRYDPEKKRVSIDTTGIMDHDYRKNQMGISGVRHVMRHIKADHEVDGHQVRSFGGLRVTGSSVGRPAQAPVRESLFEVLPRVEHMRLREDLRFLETKRWHNLGGTTHRYAVSDPKLPKEVNVSVTHWDHEPHHGHVSVDSGHDDDYDDVWKHNANKLGHAGVRHVMRHISREHGLTSFSGRRVTGARSKSEYSRQAGQANVREGHSPRVAYNGSWHDAPEHGDSSYHNHEYLVHHPALAPQPLTVLAKMKHGHQHVTLDVGGNHYENANRIGVSGVRHVMRHIAQDLRSKGHQVWGFKGERITGARAGKGLTGRIRLKELWESLPRIIKETRMPPGVIRHKQRLDDMSDEELAGRYRRLSSERGKPAEELARSDAWRHGYGRMHGHYWDRIKRHLGE